MVVLVMLVVMVLAVAVAVLVLREVTQAGKLVVTVAQEQHLLLVVLL
jgi:hypothetical protein